MPDEDEYNEDEYDTDEPDDDSFVPNVPAKYSVGMKFYLTNDPYVYGEGNSLNSLFRGKVAEVMESPRPNDEVEDWEYTCRIYDTDGITILKEREDIYEKEFTHPFAINWEERMKRHKNERKRNI